MSSRRVLGLICARGGSKGLPGKNIMPLGGKPLIAWSILAGQNARCIDRLVLSTDDGAIADTAREWGCEVPFIRPPDLATDTAGIFDVAMHALNNLGEAFDDLVLLQPTSPFRKAEDIEAGYAAMIEREAGSCVAVVEVSKSPHWMFLRNDDGGLVPLLDAVDTSRQRQQLPKAFVLNGALYAARIASFVQQRGFIGPDTVSIVMPPERSVDIDTPLDARYAEFLLNAAPTD